MRQHRLCANAFHHSQNRRQVLGVCFLLFLLLGYWQGGSSLSYLSWRKMCSPPPPSRTGSLHPLPHRRRTCTLLVNHPALNPTLTKLWIQHKQPAALQGSA